MIFMNIYDIYDMYDVYGEICWKPYCSYQIWRFPAIFLANPMGFRHFFSPRGAESRKLFKKKFARKDARRSGNSGLKGTTHKKTELPK